MDLVLNAHFTSGMRGTVTSQTSDSIKRTVLFRYWCHLVDNCGVANEAVAAKPGSFRALRITRALTVAFFLFFGGKILMLRYMLFASSGWDLIRLFFFHFIL